MRPHRSLRALRALLVDPDSFFAERRLSLARAFGVVLVVALVTTLAVALLGWLLSSSVDATVTRTTMRPWSNATCASFEGANATPPPCTIDEPRTRQVSVGAMLWDAFAGRLPAVFLGVLLGWVVVGAVLHVGSALVGGDGSFAGTLAVAGWAAVPTLAQTALALVGVWLALRGTTFAGDPAVVARQVRALLAALDGTWGVVGSLVASAWQAYVWTYGLHRARALSVRDAAKVAGGVALVGFLLSLA